MNLRMNFHSIIRLLAKHRHNFNFSYLYINSVQSTSFRFTVSPKYLYQKDDRAVSGNPQIRKCPISFSVRNVISVTTYPVSGFYFSYHSIFRLKGFVNGRELLTMCREIVWELVQRETGHANRDINL